MQIEMKFPTFGKSSFFRNMVSIFHSYKPDFNLSISKPETHQNQNVADTNSELLGDICRNMGFLQCTLHQNIIYTSQQFT